MALVNWGGGGLLALYRHKEILVNSSLKATKKKENGYDPLKNSGEQSRAILCLLFQNYAPF